MSAREWLNKQGIDYAHDGNGRIIKSWRLSNEGVDAAASIISERWQSLTDIRQCRELALDIIRAYKAIE